jgi:hypothetical protein
MPQERWQYGLLSSRAYTPRWRYNPNPGVSNLYCHQELDLEKARAKNRHCADCFQIVVKGPTWTVPKEFDSELDSDFTTWKMDMEIHFEYYEQ